MELQQFSGFSTRKKLKILKHIVIEALHNYDLSVKRIRFYAEHSNVLYLVETDDHKRFLMKVARPYDHSFEENVAYLTWLYQLHQISILPAIKPVKTSGNEFLVTVPVPHTTEVRHCALFDWIPGINLVHRMSVSNANKWGELLATIHDISEQFTHEYGHHLMRWDKVFYWDKEVIFSDTYRHLMNERRQDIFYRTVEAIDQAIQKLFRGPRQPMIIHADLHPDNIKVHNKKLFALDFEDAMWGYPVQDIAISLLYIRWRKNYPALREAFKKGYISRRSWPEQYPGEIETFFMGRLMMFANFLIKTDDEDDPEIMLGRYEDEFSKYLAEWMAKM